ncbi:ComEC/Rec2 family competence protein [Brevundimonas sp.]|uniref:ComEC/Rec2 family competence protein n=1 Tax=Brevundimonas sp. TaxID=1871086 RepID=UPI002E15028F|nr:ComEC/Rec2 family competence protein [Brevundimonas sp.]
MRAGSIRAVLIPPDAPKPSPWARAAAFLRGQAQSQALRWGLWAPVAFGGGCAVYFMLKVEPSAWPLVLGAVAATGLWLTVRRLPVGRAVTWPLMLLALFALGAANAKLKSDRVAAPIAPAAGEPVRITGWVTDVESPGANGGARVMVAPVWIGGLAPEETPLRVRATLRGAAPIAPGTPVGLFALLNPPPAPASPGAYDFGRVAWFQRMGGVAFVLTDPRPASLERPPWRLRLTMAVNAARVDLAARIVERLGPRTGGIAAAMTTGVEAWLDPDEVERMRDSGLAHILSISGLHMAVVGGFAFFAARLGIALIPPLALRINGKKAAACVGLAAVGVYLVISGAPPPAVRAAVTASIAFAAILLDRPAITMHGLAVAALVVLAIQPEAIVTPGFQMSFAATAALVALVEAWPRRPREIQAPLPILAVQRTVQWIALAALASLVAGAATAPFAMQHFNRAAMYGLVSNMTVAPISDFLIMPTLALGALLEPVGLGAPFLWLAGVGIEGMLAIGGWTAGLPGAVRTYASAPTAALPIAFMGVMVCCLVRGPLRWIGLPLACAVLLWPRGPAPDVWIGDGGAKAATVAGGRATVVRGGLDDFGVEVWSRRRGLTVEARAEDGWTCGRTDCRPAGEAVGPALLWGRRAPEIERLAAACAAAEVVAVRTAIDVLPPECASRLVLDGRDFAERGAVELWREGDGWRALWVADLRGDRPWARYGEGE